MSPRRCRRKKRDKFKPHLLGPPGVDRALLRRTQVPIPRKFVFWLHGLGDTVRESEPIRDFFKDLKNTGWCFPSARLCPVTCNGGNMIKSWFDVFEIPVTSYSPKDEDGLMRSVESIHKRIDKVIEDERLDPRSIFICGFSQGGALALATVLLYPRTLGGGAVLSGWMPFTSSKLEEILPQAQKTPIFWSHGIVDDVVLFEAGLAGPPILELAGISCEFRAYPKLGHLIMEIVLRDLQKWILRRLVSYDESCSEAMQAEGISNSSHEILGIPVEAGA